MATMNEWSGRDTRVLRQALRQTVRDFAEDLGVSPRTVSKWEAGGAGHVPRPEMQAALDTALARATDEQQARFDAAVSAGAASLPTLASVAPARPSSTSRGPGLADGAQLRNDVRALAAAYAIDELERTRGGAGLNVVFTAGRELRPWRDEVIVPEVQDRMLALVANK